MAFIGKVNKKLDENLTIRTERTLNEFGESLTTPLIFTKSGIVSTRNVLDSKNSTSNLKYITLGKQSPYYEVNKDSIVLNIAFSTNSSGKFVISSTPSSIPSWMDEKNVTFDLYYSTSQILSRYQSGINLISSSIDISNVSAEFDYSTYEGSYYFSLFAKDSAGNYLDDLNYFAQTSLSQFSSASDMFTFGGGSGIYRMVKDDNNDVYISGDFLTINGQSIPRLSKIKSDLSSLDTSFTGNVSNGIVNALCLSGSFLYIGGSFTTVSGSTRNGIAKLNKNTGELDSQFVSNVSSGQINAISLQDNILYVGGTFTSISGTTRNRLAALNPANGNVYSWDPNAGSTVNDIYVSGSTAYIAGTFTTLSGTSRNRAGAVDISSSVLASWNPDITITGSAGGSLIKISPYNNSFYLCGNFNSVSGSARFNFASIEKSTGNVITTNVISASSTCNDAIVYNNNLFIGGAFQFISSSFSGSYFSSRLTKLNMSNYSGSSYTINASSFNGVSRILQVDSQNILICGTFINYLKKLSYSSSINNFK